MKRITLGILLSATLCSAQADVGLSIADSAAVSFNGYNGQPASVTGPMSSGYTGSLIAATTGTFYATYLGNESGYLNSFTLNGGGTLLESDALYKTISAQVGPGLINFSFSDNHGGTYANGMPLMGSSGFAILSGNKTVTDQLQTAMTNRSAFDYILGFNDSFKNDADYDDFVVGINFVASPVPEAEMSAMMLAGIGLIGFAGTRRQSKK